ncbi:hypothetical protein N9Z41_01265 [bacterium]|nr:hypothetical protein [bacterium]
MDDDELEQFLEDLDDEDWVIMITPDGKLKSIMIPHTLEENPESVPESIFQALAALDPSLVKSLENLQTDLATNDNKHLRVVKPDPDDTLH